MSFISILKKVGTTVLGIEHVISPILGVVIPGAGPVLAVVDGIVTRIQNTITTVEANNPVSGNGQLKSAAVIADFQAAADLAQTIAGLEGNVLTWDQSLLQDAIDKQVAAYNAFAVFRGTFKTVKK